MALLIWYRWLAHLPLTQDTGVRVPVLEKGWFCNMILVSNLSKVSTYLLSFDLYSICSRPKKNHHSWLEKLLQNQKNCCGIGKNCYGIGKNATRYHTFYKMHFIEKETSFFLQNYFHKFKSTPILTFLTAKIPTWFISKKNHYNQNYIYFKK